MEMNSSFLFLHAFSGGIGGIIPDIDTPKSIISYKIKPLAGICKKAGHRGFFHSPICYIILNMLLLLFGVPLAVLNPLMAGISSHLLLDMLTPMGIPLFYPQKKKISLLNLKANLLVEILIGAAIIVSSFLLLCFADLISKLALIIGK